jgi:uncharacterized protein YjiS (DUF1127 family)
LQDSRPLLAESVLRDRIAAQRAPPRASTGPEPAATFPNCPVEAPRARWRAIFGVILGFIIATLREWRRRTAARRELANFDEQILRDIGVDPGTVIFEMRRSFWQPLRDWRH